MSADPDDPAPPRRSRVANSLQSARPGDRLALGARGEILSLRRYRGRQTLGWLWFGATTAFVGLFWGGVTSSLLVGLGAGGATAAFLIGRWWPTRRALLAATAAVGAGQVDAARAALAPLEGRRLDAHSSYLRAYLDYRSEWVAGEIALAAKRARLLSRRHPRDARSAADLVYLLAVEGRAVDARAALASAPPARGELFSLGRAAAELRLAFLADELPPVFDSERLHGLARQVLQTSLFGALCVLLAWAFEKNRDPEMARHMLSEAPARLGLFPWAPLDPPLHAWFVRASEREPT